jgi:hypothetical protein
LVASSSTWAFTISARIKYQSSAVRTELESGKRAVEADPWPVIAFRLKTLGLARGTDRANSGGPPRGRVCCRTAKYPLPGTYRGAIHVYREFARSSGLSVKRANFNRSSRCARRRTMTVSLLPQEGQPRSLAKARSSRKESFGNSNLNGGHRREALGGGRLSRRRHSCPKDVSGFGTDSGVSQTR